MRFITEFELEYPYSLFQIENMKHALQNGLGNKIADSFKWKELGATTIQGPVKHKASIEIEAFPMEKWKEFKTKLFNMLLQDNVSTKYFDKLIEELESFGKPAGEAKELNQKNNG